MKTVLEDLITKHQRWALAQNSNARQPSCAVPARSRTRCHRGPARAACDCTGARSARKPDAVQPASGAGGNRRSRPGGNLLMSHREGGANPLSADSKS
jgi:hypothetical protein